MNKKIILVMLWVFILGQVAVAATGVQINPITRPIQDDLKKSAEIVKQMSGSVGPKLSEIEKSFKTYQEQCKDKSGEAACLTIKSQIKAQYEEFLADVNQNLDKAAAQLSETTTELGASIRKKTGQASLQDIYNQLDSRKKVIVPKGPLSQSISQMAEAFISNSNTSPIEMSVHYQADLLSAQALIAQIQQGVSNQLIMAGMPDFNVFNSEMVGVIKSIAKDIIGYDTEFIDQIDVDPDCPDCDEPGNDDGTWE